MGKEKEVVERGRDDGRRRRKEERRERWEEGQGEGRRGKEREREITHGMSPLLPTTGMYVVLTEYS